MLNHEVKEAYPARYSLIIDKMPINLPKDRTADASGENGGCMACASYWVPIKLTGSQSCTSDGYAAVFHLLGKRRHLDDLNGKAAVARVRWLLE